MIRARRKPKFRFPYVPVLALVILAGGVWMFWPKAQPAAPSGQPAIDRVPVASATPPAPAPKPAPTSSPVAEFTPPWGNEEKLEHRGGTPTTKSITLATLADPPPAASTPADEVRLAADESIAFVDDEPRSSPTNSGAPQSAPTTAPIPPPALTNQSGPFAERVASAVKSYQSGERINARHTLNAMLSQTANPAEAAELRKHLAEFAEETIFSRLRVPNDPLIEVHRVQPKENLIEIATRFDVPHQAILLVNPGLDPKKMRAGMDLKVPHGPFHLKITKSAFRLDLYLQDLYLRSFPVGLGGETDTPTGVWRVVDRQVDPTYYPPSTASDKRVIPGKDPRNPLGTHYLKLEGIEGAAVGRTGFAVHGTNEPASIGKAESLGCIRMLNEDVEYLYKLVRSQKSLVTIAP